MRSTRLLVVGFVLAMCANTGAARPSINSIPSANPMLAVVKVGVAPSAISVDEQTRRAFVVNQGPPYSISILDTQTGAVLRTVAASHAHLDNSVSPVIVDVRHHRALALNAGSDSVSLLDATSGKLLRTVSLGFAPQFIALDGPHGRAFIPNTDEDSSEAVVAILDTVRMRTIGQLRMRGAAIALDERTGHLFISVYKGVSMVDAATGRLLATVHVDGAPIAVDATTQRVFVLKASPRYTDDFRLNVLDARTAALVRSMPLPLEATFSLIVDSRRGRAFLAIGRSIDVFDTTTGRLRRSIVVSQGPDRFANSPLAVDERTGYVYAVSSQLDQYGTPTSVAYLRVFDASRGALIKTIRIAPRPLSIAIDDQTRRVFIVHAAPGASMQPPSGQRGSVTVLDASRL